MTNKSQITNSNLQINSNIEMTDYLKFGFWNLFVICDLFFGYYLSYVVAFSFRFIRVKYYKENA